MRNTPTRVTLRAALALTLATPLAAQDVAEKPLGQPNATIKNGLKTPDAAVVLPDGRIVVVDSKLEKMVRADFASGALQDLMKQGDDNDQFGEISKLWTFGGDTIAAFDNLRQRAIILSAEGGAARFMPFGGGRGGMAGGRGAPGAGRGGPPGRGGGRGGGGRGGAMRPMAQFTPEFLIDGQHVYGFGAAPMAEQRPGFAPPRTTLPILRMSLQTRTTDTIARFLPKQPNKLKVRIPNNSMGVVAHEKLTHDIAEFIASDTWFVYRDGTVGIVRGADYHIDTYGPSDERAKLEPIPYPKVKIADGEKKRSLDQFKRAEVDDVSPGYAMQVSEGWPWPEAHPPFRHDVRPIVDDSDRVWLNVRCASTEKSECYDVINRQGQRVMRLRLPERTSLLAVSKDHVYTSFAEKADKAVLQRHPLN